VISVAGLLLISPGAVPDGAIPAGGVAGAVVILRGGGPETAGGSGSAGSSGATGRLRPSASAFLRTRSACASSIEDEWLFTPIPRAMQRSNASLFVSPSSLASS
jgi:hypothetical protein